MDKARTAQQRVRPKMMHPYPQLEGVMTVKTLNPDTHVHLAPNHPVQIHVSNKDVRMQVAAITSNAGRQDQSFVPGLITIGVSNLNHTNI